MRPIHFGVMAWLIAVLAVPSCFPPAPTPGSGETAIAVSVVAGPTCPVERDPPDPNCDPRPVEGASVLVQPADGRDIVVAQGTTDAAGEVVLEVPPGDYVVLGGAVEGLMGLPEPTPVSVVAGTATIVLAYDTGIR
jgi:hypothetical protein